MVQRIRRIAIYFGSLLLLVAAYTVTYRWGMATFEGEPRTWYGALEIVVQSMTTTGYGQDAPWESVQMTILMVAIQLTGITYIFVAFPLFVVPWLKTLVEPSPPERIDDVEDHVVIAGYTPLCASLVTELESSETPYVVIEADNDQAQELHEDDIAVIHGDPADDEALNGARVEEAAAVVIDVTEVEAIGSILAVTELNPDVEMLAFIADTSRARYLRYAGTSEVLSPKHRLGKSLGDKIRGVVERDVDGDFDIENALDVVEYPINSDSDFFDVPLTEFRRLERSGATVLGAWVRGEFATRLSSDLHSDENTTILVAGTAEQNGTTADLIGSTGRSYQSRADPVLVIGDGIIGRSVVGGLERAGVKHVLVGLEDGEQVDVVGDPTDEETLHEAGVEEARTIVVALDDGDDDAILTTLVAQQINPEAEILAAVGKTSNVSRIRSAGADYVLALPNVAGRLVTLTLSEGEAMSFDEQVHIRRLPASAIVGDHLDPTAFRDETNCAVVGVERDGQLYTVADDFEIERDDFVVVAGMDSDLDELEGETS